MKRSLALVLTVVIFAAIAVCFLRPAPPDFGYAASYDGRPVPLELEGDAEYFECAELIDVDCVVNESIYVRLRPTENTCLIPSTPAGAQKSCRTDRLVDGEWRFVAESDEGGSIRTTPIERTNTWSRDRDTLSFSARIFDTPGEYRFTLSFREVGDESRELHSVSFQYTVPRVTASPFDLLSVGWFKFPGEEELLVQLDVRPNRGTPASYVFRGDRWHGPSVEQRGILAYSALEAVDDEDFVTIQFAENPDGSGEQYTLALDFEYAVEQIEDMP